jgi:hypothetical protein
MQPPIPGLESYLSSGAGGGMSGGAGNYDPRIRELLAKGVDPRVIRTLGTENAGRTVQGAKGTQEFLGNFVSGLGALPVGRLSLVGGLVGPAMTAVEEAQAGRPTGAVGALGGGALGAAGGLALGRVALGGLAKTGGLPGLIGKVGQAALPAIGGLLGAPVGAQAAESFRQKATGEPTKGKEGEFSTQLAMAGQINELGATQYRDQLGTYTGAVRDLQRDISNQQFLDLQRNIPLIEKMKNNELIRQQALLNTQGQLQSQLGVLATAGALAQGAQAETGATLRSALTSAPYAGSVLQAPQIRFG